MIRQFTTWLSGTELSETFKVLGWLVPISQSIHILCVAVVMSSALLVVLRILGLSAAGQPLSSFRRRFLPWVWTSYGLLLLTGVLQIIAEPGRALNNPFFQVKMAVFLVVIGLTLAFQRGEGAQSPMSGGLRSRAGVFSIVGMLLLLTIVVCGRWIAYATV